MSFLHSPYVVIIRHCIPSVPFLFQNPSYTHQPILAKHPGTPGDVWRVPSLERNATESRWGITQNMGTNSTQADTRDHANSIQLRLYQSNTRGEFRSSELFHDGRRHRESQIGPLHILAGLNLIRNHGTAKEATTAEILELLGN